MGYRSGGSVGGWFGGGRGLLFIYLFGFVVRPRTYACL